MYREALKMWLQSQQGAAQDWGLVITEVLRTLAHWACDSEEDKDTFLFDRCVWGVRHDWDAGIGDKPSY